MSGFRRALQQRHVSFWRWCEAAALSDLWVWIFNFSKSDVTAQSDQKMSRWIFRQDFPFSPNLNQIELIVGILSKFGPAHFFLWSERAAASHSLSHRPDRVRFFRTRYRRKLFSKWFLTLHICSPFFGFLSAGTKLLWNCRHIVGIQRRRNACRCVRHQRHSPLLDSKC